MTAQEVLAAAATIVEISALVLTIAGIIATAFQPVPTVAQPAPATIAEVTEVPAQPQKPHQPFKVQEALEVAEIAPVASIVQQRPRTQTSSRKLSNCESLHQQCAAQGISWRNANGKGKHLTTSQMQQRLAGLVTA